MPFKSSSVLAPTSLEVYKMMYYRRKILLALLEKANNCQLSRLALQKLLFLFNHQKQVLGEKACYDFIPYRFGCYSILASKDLAVLESYYQKIKNVGKNEYRLTANGAYFPQLTAQDQELVTTTIEAYPSSPENKLINAVYDLSPYHTIKSKRKLTGGRLAKKREQTERINSKNEECLFTIGYEGISIDDYLNKLISENIELLCDVRKNPLSMKYGFSKKQLSEWCGKVGVEYVHLPGLGIGSKDRRSLKSKQSYDTLFQRYYEQLQKKEGHVTQIKEMLKKHRRVALTCFEKDPQCCHRRQITEYMGHKNTKHL